MLQRPVIILLLLSLLSPFSVHCQSKNYTLRGNIYINGGEKYPYQLVFNITHETIVGYSLTKWPNGIEPRIKIRGHIDLKQHTLAYKETEIITALPLAGTMCMADTRLKYMLRGTKYFIFGTFTGRDKNGKKCGEGAIEFEEPFIPGSLFYPDTVEKGSHTVPARPQPIGAAMKTMADTVVADEVINGFIKITEGVPRHLSWHTNSCSLLIWDGGVIDGDRISILLNGTEVLSNYMLTKSRKQIVLSLPEQVNTITIVAGDEGAAPPNTAQMILSDGSIQHKIMSYNKKGKTASIIITRK
jgi:hypothetical protein